MFPIISFHKVILLVIILFQITDNNSANAIRILGLFPHPAISHFRFFQPILRGLADIGHDVTVVGLFKHENPPNNYRDVTIPGEILTNAIGLQDDWFVNRRKYGHRYEMKFVYEWGKEACINAYNSSGLQDILRRKEQYDIILMEHFNTDCMMGVAWHLQAPVIALSSCALTPWHYDRMGNPHIPSYISSLFQSTAEKMTFSERFWNFLDVHSLNYAYSKITEPYTNDMLKKQFGNEIPSINEMNKKTSLMFVNQHYSLSGSKPLSPAVIELGGIHIEKPRPLDADIKEFLDNAIEGVIFISFGSMVRISTLPDDKRNSLVRALATLPQKVLWKWENDTLSDQPDNVHIRKWLQQREILCHPNVKAFYTHGGLMSSSEAAYCGVPVLLTPMFGDQFLNAAAFVNRGMGYIVHYEDLTTQNILEGLKNVLQPTAMKNAKKVSYSYRNRIRTPLETAIWWVEHVAATNGESLIKSHAVNMSAIEYHSLDVIAVLSAGIIVVIASWLWVLKRCLCGSGHDNGKLKSH